MRHTTRLPLAALLSMPLVACVQEPPAPRPHTTCEKVTEPVVIQDESDWDQVPNGCWDLYSTLSLSGDAITSLDKLGELKGINDLQIKNTKLTSLDAPTTLHVYGQLEVIGNSLLTSLDGLEMEEHATTDAGAIDTTVPVQITIDNNPVLTKAGNLDGATVVDGNISVTNNPKLTKLSFNGVTSVAGAIKVQNNTALTTFEMSSLTTAHDITFRNNAALTSINPMSSLEQLVGTLYVEDNAALASLAMFTSSTHDMLGVSIRNNAQLANLGQLSHLHGISSITINSNPKLSQCLAQEVSTCVPVHGTPAISNNMTATNCKYWCQQ